MTKLIDMAKSKAEMKAEQDRYKTMGLIGDSPYGHGLRVSLDKYALKKLGLKAGDVSVGEKMCFYIECEVSSISQDNTKTRDESRVELQIEKMCVEDDTAEAAVSRGVNKASY